jgi:hypothetical protein
LPLFSQNMQKWLPSTKSISTSIFRCSCRVSVSFSTTIVLLHRLGAGARRATVDAHRADAAAAVRLDAGLVAEARDVDAGGIGGFDDRLAGLGLDRLAVDLKLMVLSLISFPPRLRRGRLTTGDALGFADRGLQIEVRAAPVR